MDVRLYWTGEAPEYLPPLLEALESLPEADDAPDGEVVFCPDATAFPAPAESADGIVAAIPVTAALYHPETREALAGGLAGWAERGAHFIVPPRAPPRTCACCSACPPSGCTLATNSVMLPGTSLGVGAIAAAGSVVTKPIPAWEIWSGVPARPLRTRDRGALIARGVPVAELEARSLLR